jgi:hypothetical protein
MIGLKELEGMDEGQLHAAAYVNETIRARKRRWLLGQPCPDCPGRVERNRKLESTNDYLAMTIKGIVKRMHDVGIVERFLGDDWLTRKKLERMLSSYCLDADNAGLCDLQHFFKLLDDARKREGLMD